MRGHIAASLYEPLPEGDRQALDRHLESCAACRREAEALGRLVAALPRDPVPIPYDLTPVLRARSRTDRPSPRRWVLAAGGALAAFLAVGFFAYLYFVLPEGPSTGTAHAPSPTSPADAVLHEAERLVAAGNYTGAYNALKQFLADHPRDPRAGDAQMRVANLAYSDLRWYDVAEREYRTLIAEYPQAVDAAPEPVRHRITERRNLLDEGRRDNFALLHALDAARSNPAAAFERYESIVARNPHALAADQALREMVALSATEADLDDSGNRLAALEAARERLKNPVAVAKLNLVIGNVAWQELHDLDTAREAYRQASESPEPVLAQLARESLQALNTRNP